MTWLSDDVLNAYNDGELPPAEAARVALALTRDPDAVRRLNALRDGDALLREAFDWPLPGQTTLTDKVADKMAGPSRWRQPALQVAAVGAGVVIAAAAGFAIGERGVSREVQIDADRGAIAGGALGRALESQASDGAGPLRIALTFRAKDGRFCRQFSAYASGLEGVACRDDKGWRLEELSDAGDAQSNRPSAGERPVERALAAVGVAEPLDATQEARLIGSNWRVMGAPASAVKFASAPGAAQR